MFLPERHLLAVFHSNPVKQSVRVLSNAPESAIFDFGNLEVDGFGTLIIRILYDDADDAGGKEVADCLGREDDATPVGDGVLSQWGEGTRHGTGVALCYGRRNGGNFICGRRLFR